MPKSKTSKSSFTGLSVKERKQAGIPLDAILNPRLKKEDALCRGINYGCECVACILLLFLKKGGKVKWADIKRYNDPIKGGFKFIDAELPKWIGAGRVAQDQREQHSVAIQEQKAHETKKIHNSEIIKERRFTRSFESMKEHLMKDTCRTIVDLTDKLKLPAKERDTAMEKVREYVVNEHRKIDDEFYASRSCLGCPVELANLKFGLNESLRDTGEFSITAMRRKDHAQWKKENPDLESVGQIPMRKSALETATRRGTDVKYYTSASPPPTGSSPYVSTLLDENPFDVWSKCNDMKVGEVMTFSDKSYKLTKKPTYHPNGEMLAEAELCPVCDTDSDSEYFTAESESDSEGYITPLNSQDPVYKRATLCEGLTSSESSIVEWSKENNCLTVYVSN